MRKLRNGSGEVRLNTFVWNWIVFKAWSLFPNLVIKLNLMHTCKSNKAILVLEQFKLRFGLPHRQPVALIGLNVGNRN